jgi:hypothetical protein
MFFEASPRERGTDGAPPSVDFVLCVTRFSLWRAKMRRGLSYCAMSPRRCFKRVSMAQSGVGVRHETAKTPKRSTEQAAVASTGIHGDGNLYRRPSASAGIGPMDSFLDVSPWSIVSSTRRSFPTTANGQGLFCSASVGRCGNRLAGFLHPSTRSLPPIRTISQAKISQRKAVQTRRELFRSRRRSEQQQGEERGG